MVKYLVIIQARLSSSRLPAKVLLDLAGKTILERVYDSVKTSNKIDKIVVTTSIESSDDLIENKMKECNIDCFRGSLNNVLKRFYDAALNYQAENIIRITADNPLNGELIDHLIEIYEENNNLDYAMFKDAVYGTSPEIFSFNALKIAYIHANSQEEYEHVTPYIRNNLVSKCKIVNSEFRHPELSATIDTFDDYLKMNNFYFWCNKNNKDYSIKNFIEYEGKNANR